MVRLESELVPASQPTTNTQETCLQQLIIAFRAPAAGERHDGPALVSILDRVILR